MAARARPKKKPVPRAARRARPAPAFRVVPATRRDAPTVLSMVRGLARYEGLLHEVKATASGLLRHGFGRGRHFSALLCRCGPRPVGFALYYLTYSTFLGRPELFLEDLFVLPRWRGRGAGTALLKAVARIAERRQCARLDWLVLRDNAPAIGFYRRLGAQLHQEWIPVRLSGAPLRRLARG